MTFKAASLILAIALLVPTAVKFSHVFSHHQHEICTGESQTHLHKSDIDCNFYKFKLTSSFTLLSIVIEFVSIEDNHSVIDIAYAFNSEFRQLQLSLRGPPRFNLL